MTETKDELSKILGLGRASVPMLRRKPILLLGGFAAVIAVALAAALGGGGENVHYTTQPVSRGDLLVTVSATGTLQPLKVVDIGIEVSGTVRSVAVDCNDTVTVGQVLAELDTSKLEAQVLQSQAALESAKAKVLQSQASLQEAQSQLARLNRVRELSGGKMPSQSELDTAIAAAARATADEASAKASVTQWQATLDAHRTDLSKAVIHSPINGIVLTRSVEPGQTVAAAFQAPVLFTVAENLTQMELQVDVDEADVGQVREGQEATFTVDAYPDQTFPAQITQVRYGSETVAGVVTYKTVLRVDNPDLSLRPGMTATAIINVSLKKDALLAPNAALRFAPPESQASSSANSSGIVSKLLPRPPRPEMRQPDNTNGKEQPVWILKDGELASVSITKGATDGTMTEILAGDIQPGMELVIDAAGKD